MEFALVPRTRSSHHNCCESGCELRVQSGTRIIELLVSFDSEVRIGACCKLGRTSESRHQSLFLRMCRPTLFFFREDRMWRRTALAVLALCGALAVLAARPSDATKALFAGGSERPPQWADADDVDVELIL